MKEKEIRAQFDNESITVYQAYNKTIADAAVRNQKFIPPFKIERMTWIKPSFLWMMYRAGWGSKANQEHILKIRIKRSGFEWALEHSCLSHFDSRLYTSLDDWKKTLTACPVRIQWDPEKDIFLNNLNYRSIQIGLSDIAVEKFINEWIISIEDISDQCKTIHSLILNQKTDEAKQLLPLENNYPVPDELKNKIDASSYLRILLNNQTNLYCVLFAKSKPSILLF